MLATTADPLCETPRPVETLAPLGSAASQAPTILLVEDSSTQRRLVQYLLQKTGNWNVIQAVDGVAALELMEYTSPNIVLTDMYMPRMDGLALVEEIRRRFPQVPVVVMTGEGSEQMAADALKAGATDCVCKANLGEALARVLNRVLENIREESGRHRLQSGMTGRITRFVLENDSALVAPLIAGFRDDLLHLGLCDQNAATRVGIALEEALLNAIYHGNLEVSSELKRDGDEPFHRLVELRRNQRPYCERRVFISARMTRQKATFVIADEGPGFDVTQIPDPTEPANLDRPSGRGLLLMHMFMDSVRHNSKGNQITLVKHRKS